MDPKRTAEIVKIAQEGVQNLLKHTNAETNAEGKPWVLKLSKPEMKMQVFDSEAPGSSMRRFKCVIDIPYSPEVVQRTIHDNIARLKWDTNIQALDTVVVQETGPKVIILHSATKAVGPISARDFVDITAIDALPNGNYISGGAGIVDLATFPEQSGFVRGWNTSGGGWLFEAIPGPTSGTLHCRVHYVIHTDLKGWMPSMVVNSALTGSYVTFFGDYLKYMQENPGAATASAASSGAGGGGK